MPSLSDKLKALGVKVGTADLPQPPLTQVQDSRKYSIDAVVRGDYRPTPLGEVFVAEQSFNQEYRHGLAPILPVGAQNIVPLMAQWARNETLGQLPLEAFAFLDTETSGLSGGTGTYAFLVGAARFVNGQFVLQQFFMRDPAEEAALLEGLANFLAPAKALVTFNGKAFDAPLLVTRYTLHRLPLPFKGYAHLDLLPLARRLWRERLPSRALKYLEEHVLGMTRTTEEVPGYEIPWLYFDYLRSGDARPLAGVFYHNAMDVVALAALLAHTGAMIANPFDGQVQHGLDFIALARLFEDLGHWDEAARLYERGLQTYSRFTMAMELEDNEVDPPAPSPVAGLEPSEKLALTPEDFSLAVRRLSILHKRRGDLEQALNWWEQAAAEGHLYAFVELAKYYEHRRRDVKSAIQWTKSAKKQLARSGEPEYIRKYWRSELDHRLKRLQGQAAT